MFHDTKNQPNRAKSKESNTLWQVQVFTYSQLYLLQFFPAASNLHEATHCQLPNQKHLPEAVHSSKNWGIPTKRGQLLYRPLAILFFLHDIKRIHVMLTKLYNLPYIYPGSLYPEAEEKLTE